MAKSAECIELEKRFETDLKNSLEKVKKQTPCKYDCVGSKCYQKNPVHRLNFSHGINYADCHVSVFKEDTDKFIENIHNIYECYGDTLLESADYSSILTKTLRTEDDYTKYDSLYFNIIANIAIHIDDYKKKYSANFLKNLLMSLEELGITGLFKINDPTSVIRQKIDEYARQNGEKPDYRLANTTIYQMIDSRQVNHSPETSAESPRKRRRHLTVKNGGTKRKTHKKKKKTHKKKRSVIYKRKKCSK
jgi:hypothetical protein